MDPVYVRKFVRRLLDRRPQDKGHYQEMLRVSGAPRTESPGDAPHVNLETIVKAERPVLFVQGGKFNTTEVAIIGPEAAELVANLNSASAKLLPLMHLIGRIDVLNFPGGDFVGTGWFVAEDVVVTNRHVASLIARWDGRQFAFTAGVGARTIEPSFCNAHEYDDPPPPGNSTFKITNVLYIEPDSGPNDIAFLRVTRRADGATPRFLSVATADVGVNEPVCVIGYPARASRRTIPDQALMQQLYLGKYDVKRAAPGLGMGTRRGLSEHDCTTLGGNSGSVVVNLDGRAVGLHFAGLYGEANYAVRATTLNEYIRGERWRQPLQLGSQSPPSTPPGLVVSAVGNENAGGSISIMIPLTLTLGMPYIGSGLANPAQLVATPAAGPTSPPTVAQAEEAVKAFWASRPDRVVAARVGFDEANGEIGHVPFVAAAVPADRLTAVQALGPQQINGVPIRYFPATIDEQLQLLPELEALDQVAYDDSARTGPGFSFEPVDENMEVTMHVGPEYSWDVLSGFLQGQPNEALVASMYEFHATYIKDAIEARLVGGGRVRLVLDSKTFITPSDGEEFEALSVFQDWADRHEFQRIVAPRGREGLMATSYHTKVAVRQDDTFWLSSGNWKPGSSQPVTTQDQRDSAATEDVPGNREWHVVIKNARLAERFRNHILQDFVRSEDLGGREVPRRFLDETILIVPEEEAPPVRLPPGRVKRPLTINRQVKVRPLMTPDLQGEVYCEAMLELIRSAQTSLLFQIPYIGVPSIPNSDRGYLDDLISALIAKLTSLSDARVILRTRRSGGGSEFSSPTHVAWYLRSKGVDIDTQLREIDNHHTKGMVVDGRRVLIGSHNWSVSGVTLNRDASLLFDDNEVASYYGDAFEIDWQRASRVRPREFVREFVTTESVGMAAPIAYRPVLASHLLSDD